MPSERDAVTEVDLLWWRERAEVWIRFGRPDGETIHDRRRRTVRFAPDAVFGLVRWASNDYGTVRSELDIVRAVRIGEPYTTRPHVRPGAELLAAARGWLSVSRALAVIDAIETAGFDPACVAPDYWRHVHNRLLVGLEPRPYQARRHRAWRLRRRVTS
jgi:hypothetical protein